MSLRRSMMAQPSGGGAGTHSYWRIRITANVSSNYSSISEIQFRATPGGADQASGGTASASGSYASGYEASKAFDDSNSTQWASNAALPSWISYQFPSPVAVQEVAIISTGAAYGDPGRSEAPKTFTIQYSDDGTAWTTAASPSDQTGWGLNETRLFSV